MWEAAVNKNPNDAFAWQQYEAAEKALAEAEKGLSRNYVVFDDNLIEIMRKYGLLGGVGLGTILGANQEGNGT
jgi:hypothetical protein